MTFTIIPNNNDNATPNNYMRVHKSECKDIKPEAKKYHGQPHQVIASDVKSAIKTDLENGLKDQGYDETHYTAAPCTK